jgi:hypothetical protein
LRRSKFFLFLSRQSKRSVRKKETGRELDKRTYDEFPKYGHHNKMTESVSGKMIFQNSVILSKTLPAGILAKYFGTIGIGLRV